MHSYLLSHLLRDSALQYPDNIAVLFKDTFLDYKTLEKKSTQLALLLRRMGVGKGARIGIMLSKCPEAIIAIFAVLKTGAAYVPIDIRAPRERIHFIIDNCEILFVVTTADGAEKIVPLDGQDPLVRPIILTETAQQDCSLRFNGQAIFHWGSVDKESLEDFDETTISDQNPAYILYTSGSTGTPKGVVISHQNSLSFVTMAAEFFGIHREDKIASHAPLHFDLSIFDIFVAIKKGATIVLVPEFLATFPAKMAAYIDQKGVSVWNSVSSTLVLLASRGNIEKYRFEAMRLVHFSGDILPIKYFLKLQTQMPKAAFYNIYGQSEANSSMCYQVKSINKAEGWKIPVGRPFPNFEVFALKDGNTVAVRPGEEGELYVKSATVALGYWRDEERTRANFITDPTESQDSMKVYRTGDMVRLDEECNYVFVGRKDSMVKSRGYRIELDEIEIVLHGHPSVKQAAAVPIPDELIGNRITAYVSLVEGQSVVEEDLFHHCGKTLPKYMIPDLITVMDALPETSTGKIDRNSLKMKASEKKGDVA